MLQLLVLLGIYMTSNAQTAEERIQPDVQSFWNAVPKTDGEVSASNLHQYFLTFELDQQTKNGVNENEFGMGFSDSIRTPEENARAYFKILDLYYDSSYLEILDFDDSQLWVDLLDTDSNGRLSESEFVFGFKRNFYGMPISTMYIGYRDERGTGYYDDYHSYLAWWEHLFRDIDTNRDGKLTPEELAVFFSNSFGDRQWGFNMFDFANINGDEVISEIEWDISFLTLDNEVGDGALQFEEFYQLRLLAPFYNSVIHRTQER